MFRLDNEFKETYEKYYGKMAPHEVAEFINEDIRQHSVMNIFNTAKTSDIVGHTYMEFFFEASKDPIAQLPNGEQIIFNTAFYYAFTVDADKLESFLGIRFKVRDVYAEIAYKAYGKANEEDIERIKGIDTPDSYSIQAPNPVSRDRWFYDMALAVGSYAKCHSRKIGAVLVKNNSVISTGYNGPPRGVPTCDQRWFIDETFKAKYGDKAEGKETKGICPRRVIGFPSGQGLEICPAGHAERNALINAARLGIKTDNTKIYMSCGLPCTPCMVEIINAGVEEIICTKVFPSYDETAMYLLENSDLNIRLYDFLV